MATLSQLEVTVKRRPCQVIIPNQQPYKGWVLKFSTDHEQYESGPAPFPVAVVEDEAGQLASIYVKYIRMLDTDIRQQEITIDQSALEVSEMSEEELSALRDALEPAPVTEQTLVTDETIGEAEGFNQFFLKYGNDFCRELIEEIAECHLSGAGSKRVDIFDTLRHNELNFTYQGTVNIEDVEWWYTIESGDWNGTVVKEWCLNHPSDADPIEEKPTEYSHNGLTRRMVVEAFEEVDEPPFGVDVWPHMINLKFDGICVQFYGPTVRTYSQGIETTQRWNDWKSLVGKQLNERGIDPEWWKKMKPAIQVIIDTMQIPETV